MAPILFRPLINIQVQNASSVPTNFTSGDWNWTSALFFLKVLTNLNYLPILLMIVFSSYSLSLFCSFNENNISLQLFDYLNTNLFFIFFKFELPPFKAYLFLTRSEAAVSNTRPVSFNISHFWSKLVCCTAWLDFFSLKFGPYCHFYIILWTHFLSQCGPSMSLSLRPLIWGFKFFSFCHFSFALSVLSSKPLC